MTKHSKEVMDKRRKLRELRSKEILRLKKSGLSIKEISKRVFVGERTIYNALGKTAKEKYPFKIYLEVEAYTKAEALSLLRKRLNRDYINFKLPSYEDNI